MAKKEYLIFVGIAMATLGIANIPGIYQASSNWKTGISGQLDKPANQLMRGIATNSGTDWIADDQEAFARAVEEFIGHVEVVRKHAEAVGGTVESIAKMYMDYWLSIGSLILSVAPMIFALWALAKVPHPAVSIPARIAKAVIGVMVVVSVAMFVDAVRDFLNTANNIFSAVLGAGSTMRLATLAPTGTAAVNFTDSKITWTPPSQFVEPNRPTPAPHGP
ncbi:hypothetical protein [Actinomadura rugatobispora]|uniref:Transmembrane protein n=1 Tax=Actinomadura rugatobispora TaxID=1994 RepID=A0ABW1AA00_9ACTN|nr:hypothetical protein GCM10010200_045970 [Actinomadura rugatobispora]